VIWRFVNTSAFETRAQAVRQAVAFFADDKTLPDRVYGFNVRDNVECRRGWHPPSFSFAVEMEQCEQHSRERKLALNENNSAESLK
jgi:hypothetical protein